ncbi:MAG: hypothetical protein D3924_10940 [Candidatus Electrothrix sp. AR4]|nr:hypothetical protein [Candidatus Electrothrix sp. AR4]
MLLLGCDTQDLEQVSTRYKAHRDYASLEVIHRHLRQGMARTKVEGLMGEADYSPIAGQYYYSSDRQETERRGKEQVTVSIGLVVDYRDEQGGLTEQLQAFRLGRIGE